ncbi:amidase [Bacillus sp. JCM 19047]|nr:amidase [Bacillus sp. JCM 19047]
MMESRAFIQRGWSVKENKREGSLHTYTFAVKDVFDIQGHTSSAGNPDWLATHETATTYAPAIKQLLHEGATLVGTTLTDELMFSLNGENVHYGTPINPVANDRIPGGSSSGSAVAVAGGSVDFALGTDTAGSVRIPASYCGIYGFRPTHNAVSIEGVIPLAARFDTVGWFARSASLLENVGNVLLPKSDKQPTAFSTVYVPEEALQLVQPQVAEAFLAALKAMVGELTIVSIRLTTDRLDTYMETFRTLQGYQIWQTHREWIETQQPTFADDIATRFRWTSTITIEEQRRAEEQALIIKSQLQERLKNGGLLAIPTSPDVAPLVGTDPSDLEVHRTNTFKLTAISGLAESPQVTMPRLTVHGLPVGLSFLAHKHNDLALLQFARSVQEKEEVLL